MDDLHSWLTSRLSTHPLTCTFTSYDLYIVEESFSKKPVLLSDNLYLDDALHEKFNVLLEQKLESKESLVLQMTLALYNLQRVTDHVNRFKEVLASPPISLSDMKPIEKQSNIPETTGESDSDSDSDVESSAATDAAEGSGETPFDFQKWRDSIDEVVKDAEKANKEVLFLPLPVQASYETLFPTVLPLDTVDGPKVDEEAVYTSTGVGAFEKAPALPVCIHSLTFSGWNPPPAHRVLQGDIAYLRLETVEKQVFHITCSPQGFYVNQTTENADRSPGVFNPKPHVNAAYKAVHHSLVQLVAAVSPSFKNNYTKLFEVVKQIIKHTMARAAKAASPELFPFACPKYSEYGYANSALNPYRTEKLPFSDDAAKDLGGITTGADASLLGVASAPSTPWAFSSAQWLVPQLTENIAATDGASAAKDQSTKALESHSYNESRANQAMHPFEQNTSSTLNNPDWNAEYQTFYDAEVQDSSDLVNRSKSMVAVMNAFINAAVEGVAGILNGSIQPYSKQAKDVLEPGSVYTHNNIFYSLVEDKDIVRGKMKAKILSEAVAAASAGGKDDDATASSTNVEEIETAFHDLNGIRSINTVQVPGVHTLPSAVIQHGAYTFWAQGILPGILQSETMFKILYGTGDEGVTWHTEESAKEKLIELGSALGVANRPITPVKPGVLVSGAGAGTKADAENASAEDQEPAHLGPMDFPAPFECKVVEGSDKRMYVIDYVRSTPKDILWLAGKEKDVFAFAEQDSEKESAEGQESASAAATTDDAAKKTDPLAEKISVDAVVVESSVATEYRRELLSLHAAYKRSMDALAASKKKKEKGTSADAKDNEAENEEDATASTQYNVNAFTRYATYSSEEQKEEDERKILDLGSFLLRTVLPRKLSAWIADDVPMDGRTLTKEMHSSGINMRYLGLLSETLAKNMETSRAHAGLVYTLETEMIARAAKKVLTSYILMTKDTRTAPAVVITSFLNSLLGSPIVAKTEGTAGESEAGTKAGKDTSTTTAAAASDSTTVSGTAPEKEAEGVFPSLSDGKTPLSAATLDLIAANITCRGEIRGAIGAKIQDTVWTAIEAEIESKYRAKLHLWDRKKAPEGDEPSTFSALDRNPLLRRICQLFGIQLAAKSYDFKSTRPFVTDNVQGILPRIKTSLPLSDAIPLARQLRFQGDNYSANLMPIESFRAYNEARTLYFRVGGLFNAEVAHLSERMALVYYADKDYKNAIDEQSKAVMIYERVDGPDSISVASAHLQLSLYFLVSRGLGLLPFLSFLFFCLLNWLDWIVREGKIVL